MIYRDALFCAMLRYVALCCTMLRYCAILRYLCTVLRYFALFAKTVRCCMTKEGSRWKTPNTRLLFSLGVSHCGVSHCGANHLWSQPLVEPTTWRYMS